MALKASSLLQASTGLLINDLHNHNSSVFQLYQQQQNYNTAQVWIQDFPLGGTNPHWRGHQPPTQALFSENICKNERIWSCWGGVHWKLLYVDPPLLLL